MYMYVTGSNVSSLIPNFHSINENKGDWLLLLHVYAGRLGHLEGFQVRDQTGDPEGRSIFTFSSPF